VTSTRTRGLEWSAPSTTALCLALPSSGVDVGPTIPDRDQAPSCDGIFQPGEQGQGNEMNRKPNKQEVE
jgi:hypothetical protein